MTATWHIGDTRTVLATLPDASVDLVLTSPPFLALRSYLPADDPNKALEMGSEATPGEFIDGLLDVVEECRRVLAPHGSLCIELGDTYAGSGGAGGDYGARGLRDGQQAFTGSASRDRGAGGCGYRFHSDDFCMNCFSHKGEPTRTRPDGNGKVFRGGQRGPDKQGPAWPLDKSLCLIPESFRFALAYGRNPHTGRTIEPWRVRNVVRWCRPNPPVGALADKFRPATSEMVIACTGRSRYFDLDAVRQPHQRDPEAYSGNGYSKGNPEGIPGNESMPGNPAGAPPLDWWQIPTQPYAGKFVNVRLEPCGPRDGGQRTTSPDCPVHGGQPDPAPTAPRGGRGGTASIRTSRTDPGPAQVLLDGFAPTGHQDEHSTAPSSSDSPPPACAPPAMPHNTASHRTGLAPETNPPGSACGETSADTDDTSASPSSAAPHPGTPSSSNDEACPPADVPGTGVGTAHSGNPSRACTCSWLRTVTQSTSHYATWPEDLCITPILAMCPQRVCTTCGRPSERITEADRVPRPTSGPLRGGANRSERGRGNPGVDDAGNVMVTTRTLGWSTCGHDAWRPGIVLDPFAGSGTTGAVAIGHGRSFVGIDIDSRNVALARERMGMFLTEVIDARSEADRSGGALLAQGRAEGA